jgi:DNA repair protein RecO (recombination protein O)
LLLSSRGIVFRTVKYGETSVIADIFTEEKGLHAFIGGSVRTAKSRMPFNLFQPMSVVDLVAYYRDDENHLNRLKEVRAAEIFTAIPFDVRKGAVALFMAEICRKCVHDHEPNPELFDFLLDHLRLLDRTAHPIANLHLNFLAHLSGFLGFQPESESGEENFFDLKEGIFTDKVPGHPDFLEAQETAWLRLLLETPAEDCHTLPLSRTERKGMQQRLLQFYRFHMPGFDGVNTPDVLDMVF